MSKDYEIKWKDPVLCTTCGHEIHPKEDFRYIPTDVKLNEDGLKEMAKNRKERNEIYEKARKGEIDHYRYYEEICKINTRERKAERIRSSFHQEISGKCPNCGVKAKTTVEGRVLIEQDKEPTDFDVFRKMPLPDDKVLGQLLRLDVAWISQDEYADLLTLQKQAKEDSYKERQLERKEKDIKTRFESSPSTIEWIKESLLKPMPDLDAFIKKTLQSLEKVKGLEKSFKGEFENFLKEFKEDVKKEHNKRFSRYLNAVYRLARQNVGITYP